MKIFNLSGFWESDPKFDFWGIMDFIPEKRQQNYLYQSITIQIAFLWSAQSLWEWGSLVGRIGGTNELFFMNSNLSKCWFFSQLKFLALVLQNFRKISLLFLVSCFLKSKLLLMLEITIVEFVHTEEKAKAKKISQSHFIILNLVLHPLYLWSCPIQQFLINMLIFKKDIFSTFLHLYLLTMSKNQRW